MARHGRFTMTRTEIDEACARLSVAPPVTLASAPTPFRSPRATASSESSAPRDPARLREVLATLADPEALLLAHRSEPDGPAELRMLAASSTWSVEQTARAYSCFDFELWDSAAVMERVLSFCRLEPRPFAVAGPCEMSGRAWLDVLARAADDPAGTVRILRNEGVAAADAEALVVAVGRRRRIAQVTTLNRPNLRRLEGTTVGWIDGADAGLWEVVAPKVATSSDYGRTGDMLLEMVQIHLKPTTTDRLLAEITRGFPPSLRRIVT